MNRFVLVVKSRAVYVRVYTKLNVILSIAATWTLALLLGSPPYLGFGNVGYYRKVGACFVLMDDPVSKMFLNVFGIGCCFVPTLVITIYCYLGIMVTFIRSRERVKPTIGNTPASIPSISGKESQSANARRLSHLPELYKENNSSRLPETTTAEGIRLDVRPETTRHLYGERKLSGSLLGRLYPINRASLSVLKRILAVWIVFFVCWLPFIVLIMVEDSHERVSAITMHVAFIASQSNAALNPVVYFGIGPEFRHAAMALAQKWRTRM